MISKLILLLAIFCNSSGAEIKEESRKRTDKFPLNDGNSIPQLGLGTFLGFAENGLKKPDEFEVSNAVEWALSAGYRLIDTAAAYNDENQVGLGVKNSIARGILKREDVFITTKLSLFDHREVKKALRESLKHLDMDYVDLYLIHFPTSLKADFSHDDLDYLVTWKEMEEVKELGLTKSIGVSNFNISQLQRVVENSKVKPAALQIEVHLNFAEDELIKYANDNGIAVMAYTPFGTLFDKKSGAPPYADDPILVEIANKYKKTVPQVALRYLIQRCLVPIPKSVNKDRIEQNIDVFDFALDGQEMEKLAQFNTKHRIVWPTFFQDHPYFPFEKKEVKGENPFLG